MQLKSHTFIRGALAAASCTLLNGTAHATQPVDSWKLDSALLYYSEVDRVSVTEPVIYGTKQVSEDESYTIRAVYDSITGATPIGAAPSSQTQTISSVSGGSDLIIAPGKLPTKPFSDQRTALGVDWSNHLSRLLTRNSSFDLSVESDYASLGGNITMLRDSADRMNTFAAALGVSFDRVSPYNGTPPAMQSITTTLPAATTTSASGGSGSVFSGKSKNTYDMLLGYTRVLSRRALLQINVSHSTLYGYLNDPYKVVSLVDSNGLPTDYVWESRPDHRNANSLFAKWVYHLPHDVVHLAARYFSDSWGIRSHTYDFTYHMTLPAQIYLEPHLRYYRQTQADFYHTSLPDWQPLPAYASADYRMAPMTSRSIGVKVGIALDDGSEVKLRYERMIQRGDAYPADAIGTQQGLDLYPGLDANIVQLSYSTLF